MTIPVGPIASSAVNVTVMSVGRSGRRCHTTRERLARRAQESPLDPGLQRTVVNRGEEIAAVLIVSAPRTSGYEPLDWA